MPTKISDSSINQNNQNSDALGSLEDGTGFEKIEMKERRNSVEKEEKCEKKVVQVVENLKNEVNPVLSFKTSQNIAKVLKQ
ncbi:hypothetical protein B9Z55_004137 [Caenorhabditis nigoni]|uniref:Uncharacterized protein n=1 Tax=Caenorhabditis nigoni TaxID=1611254 RepID=A0A2G5UVV6_9PELO|nr:hypothetical protein B9Z55_004137 [Caenorhabditis nigoni]